MKGVSNNQNVAWFYQKNKNGLLELSPDFQRKRVWQPIHKDYLLETIFLELPIPEIYFVNRIDTDTGDSVIVVVDGQQRLGAIMDFVNGEYEIHNPIRGFENIRTFSDLNETQKQKFWRYPIIVRDLEDSDDEEIRHIFRRINKYAFPLNDQELRNARFQGKFIQTIEKISENPFWINSGIFTANDFRRMLDLEYISILCATLMGGIFNRKEKLDEFYAQYEYEFDESEEYIKRIRRDIKIIENIIPDLRKTTWSNKANFYALFLVVDQLATEFQNKDNIQVLQDFLHKFIENVEKARISPEDAEELYRNYSDAARVATNDKDKRVRRYRILLNCTKEALK